MMSNWLEIHKNQWHVQKLTYIRDCMRLSKLRLFSYFDKYFYFIDLILMFHKWFAVRTYLYIFAWTFTSLFVFFHAVPCDGTVESKFGYLLCNFFFWPLIVFVACLYGQKLRDATLIMATAENSFIQFSSGIER